MERKSTAMGAVTRRTDAEWERSIRVLYLEQRHSDREIAVALGCNRVTVTRRRLALGIRPEDRRPAEAVA